MSLRIISGMIASAAPVVAFSAILSNCTPLEQGQEPKTTALLPGYNPPSPELGTSSITPDARTGNSSSPQDTGTSKPAEDCTVAWQSQFGNDINHAETSGPRAKTPGLLSYINALRSLQCLCDGKAVGPAPALSWNEGLATAALENATTRASHASIRIDDASKAITLSRALKAGYPTQSIMEYAAYGPTTSFSFLRALIQDPQICTKLMDPQIQDVGAAYAIGISAPPNEQTRPETKHFYWDILLGEQISLSRPF